MSNLGIHRCGHCGGTEGSGHLGNCEGEDSKVLAERCDDLQAQLASLPVQAADKGMRALAEEALACAEATTPGEWKRIKGETEDGAEGYAWLNESGHDLFQCNDPNKRANIIFVHRARRYVLALAHAALSPTSAKPSPESEEG